MQLQLQSDLEYYGYSYLLGYILGFFVILIIIAIISYILSAIIYQKTAKTNGFHEIAYLSWIPIINIYVLFALGSKKTTIPEVKSDALKVTLIYFGLVILGIIPFIGFLAGIALIILAAYYSYRLFYRWTGDQTKSILFVVLMYLTCGIFFYVYGLLKMKERFIAW